MARIESDADRPEEDGRAFGVTPGGEEPVEAWVPRGESPAQEESPTGPDPEPTVFGEGGGAPGGEEPIAVAIPDREIAERRGALAEVSPGEAPVAGAEIIAYGDGADQDEVTNQVAEGYLDMGESWGYTADGQLRTVRDEVVETPIEPETAPLPKNTKTQRKTSQKQRGSGSTRTTSSKRTSPSKSSSRKSDKRRGSRA